MKYLTMILALPLLVYCKYFKGDNCNNTLPIVGTYENIYDKQAKNLLIIKEDGTFEQVFTKNGETRKNSGTWKFFNESCNLKLQKLKLMHEIPNQYKDYFREKGKYRLNKIVFIEDLPKVFDFYRVDE